VTSHSHDPARRLLVAVVVGSVAVALVASGRGHRSDPSPPAAPPIVVVGGPTPLAAPDPSPLEVSRSFVDAYVGFIYGRLGAAQLPHLSPRVRRQAERQHPNPAAAVLAAADPRLRSLRMTPRGPTAARAVAVIEDGAAVYDVSLVLQRRANGWTITRLGETG
jgi:hypothetical protein